MTRPDVPSITSAAGPRRRSWPAGLVGMLALVAAIELATEARHLDFATVATEDWRRTAAAASTQAPGRDVLCFGDSLVKYGVLPRVIEARSGLKAYNLAINAGPMPAQFFLLRRALAAGARPRAVVADFFPLMLPDEPRGSTRAYPELATWGDCLDLARTARDGEFLAATWLGKLLPTARCRFEVRERLLAMCAGRPVSRRQLVGGVSAVWKQQLGAQPMPGGAGPAAADPGLVASLTPDHWACDPINTAYFERFVALAEAHRVAVFWVMPPLGPEVRAGRVARGTDEAYARFARRAQRRHPGLVVLDARGAGYDGSAHVDPIHLNDRGAAVLSGDVAAALGAALGGRSVAERWHDLPPLAGRARAGDPAAAVASGGGAAVPVR